MLEGNQISRVKMDRKLLGPALHFLTLEQGKLDGVREADPSLRSKYDRAWEFGNN